MRRRSIKPSFWTSEDVDKMDWHTRLVFIALWSYVDDNGVGIDRVASIAGECFSADLIRDPRELIERLEKALDRLVTSSHVIRYEIEGRKYLYLTGWHHQRIIHPNRPRYPLPTCENVPGKDPNEVLIRPSVDSSEVLNASSFVVLESGSNNKPKRRVYPKDFETFWAVYPRRVGKPKALTAWKAATKRSSVADVLLGAERFAKDPNLPGEAYQPYPATWLNRDGWEDGPLPKREDNVRQIRPTYGKSGERKALY
jgi:hypothetical protein